MQSKSGNTFGTLFVVATPIGHLGDWTYRAVETVRDADVVACEDTRVSRVLLAHYGLRKTLIPYHEHNTAREGPKLLQALQAGRSVALLSDAGTPLISDPGFDLVRQARAHGIAVHAIPGACSALVALTISGLAADRFLFLGFPPAKAAARKSLFAEYASVRATLIFFESPKRLLATLTELQAALGDRQAAVARELTKLYEECPTGTLSELKALYAARSSIKGEIVILVAPPPTRPASEVNVDGLLSELLQTKGVKETATEAAALLGLPRKMLYQRALAIREKKL